MSGEDIDTPFVVVASRAVIVGAGAVEAAFCVGGAVAIALAAHVRYYKGEKVRLRQGQGRNQQSEGKKDFFKRGMCLFLIPTSDY